MSPQASVTSQNSDATPVCFRKNNLRMLFCLRNIKSLLEFLESLKQLVNLRDNSSFPRIFFGWNIQLKSWEALKCYRKTVQRRSDSKRSVSCKRSVPLMFAYSNTDQLKSCCSDVWKCPVIILLVFLDVGQFPFIFNLELKWSVALLKKWFPIPAWRLRKRFKLRDSSWKC